MAKCLLLSCHHTGTLAFKRTQNISQIHTDGFVSFEADTTDVPSSEFPFREALLAPYMTDLDTTEVGEIYYREHTDNDVTARATRDVRRAFGETDEVFEASSVFVITWHGVRGTSVEDEVMEF